MSNGLAHSSSPYLRQHAENPVDWLAWGSEAFTKATQEDKPIFLSIGYAACHWCHVMARESFEDPATADLLNRFFVPVKVDREERPDVDAIYMEFVVSLTGQGGWPLSVFLTPGGQPFFGGTYFPNVPRNGLPSFRSLLRDVAREWKENRGQLQQQGEAQTEHLRNRLSAGRILPAAVTPALVEEATQTLLADFDWQNGGWGSAPKFPQATAIEFLLGRSRRGSGAPLMEAARRTLEALARGGVRDQVGGGFHRYAVDAGWRVPHFEKMLYDNALLSTAFLHAWQLTREEEFRDAAEGALDFMAEELLLPDGGFASSLDADSEGAEGKYYLWSAAEVRETLGATADQGLRLFGLKEQGDFEGLNVLHLPELPEHVLGPKGDARTVWLAVSRLRRALRTRRGLRARPARDEKVIASWNGLALSAFSEAARLLEAPQLLDVARRNAEFLSTRLVEGKRAHHSWFAGEATSFGFLEDQVGLAAGFLEYYQTTFEEHYFELAVDLCGEALQHFRRAAGGFFDTADDHEALLLRPSNLQDQPVPSASATACTVLLRLYSLSGKVEYLNPLEEILPQALTLASRYPTAFAQWMLVADLFLRGVTSVAIVGAEAQGDEEERSMLKVLREAYCPGLVVTRRDAAVDSRIPALNEKPLLDGRSTAYVCAGSVCYPPVTQAASLSQQLASASVGRSLW